MNLEEAEKSYETAEIGDKEPEIVKLSDAEKDFTGDVTFGGEYFNYKRGALGRIGAGAVDTLSSLGTYTDKLKVFGGMAVMSIGDNLDSEKTTTVGKEMIKIAQHNIDENEKYLKYASPEEVKSFAYALGGGAFDYGLMFLTGGVAGAIAKGAGAGVATAAKIGEAAVFAEMAGLSAGEEAQERIEKYKQRTGDVNLENYTPEMAKKNLLASSVYALGEGILEKWAFKEQKILFTNPKTMLKTGSLAALKEGGTEALQSALDIGIDLADGTLEWKELPDALRGMLMEAAVGGILGFSAGMAVSYAQRNNAIKYLNENLSKAIPNPEERARMATEIVDKSIEKLQEVVVTGLKYSTEFRDKYGDTFNAMQKATLQAMKDSGGYEGMTEDELAQLATSDAQMFADQTAAEAIKRNELIQDVVNSQDIVYDPEIRGLRLAPKGEKQGQLLFQEANDVAQRINEIDAEEAKNGVPEYTAPTININGVEKQTTNSNGDPIAKSEKSLRYFYDWFGDSKVINDKGQPLVMYHGTDATFSIFDIRKARNGSLGRAFYFTPDGSVAERKGKNVMPVYLRIQNPVPIGRIAEMREKFQSDWNNYDGVIYIENGKIQEVAVRKPELIKRTDNRGTFAITNEAVYYQEGQDDRNLVVYHNISKQSLEKAMKLGGLPVPSLAITKKDIPFGRFGEISLVGNKEMIDPSNYKNEVYNRDVWSATFPQTEYSKPKDSAIKKFKNKFGKFFEKAGDNAALSSFVYSLTFSPARAEHEISNSLGMKLAYIETELGKDVEVPKKDFGESILEENKIDKKFVEDVKDVDMNGDNKKIRKEVTKAYLTMLDRKDYSEFGKYAEKMKNIEKTGEGVFDKEDGLMYFNRADTLLYAAKKYLRERDKTVIDDTALRQKIDDMIKDKQAYREWSRNTLEYELLGEPKIEVGRSLKPITLQNIVDAMTSGETKNAQESFVFGTGKVIAAGAKKLESIADIKLESGKIVSEEEEKAIHEKLTEDITSFSNSVLKAANIPFDFNAMSAAHAALGHIATLKNPTVESLQKALNKEMGEKHIYPRYLLENGVKLAEEVKGLVRHYFEAKPQRAVMLNEFSGAIVPTSSEYNDVAQRLQDVGLKVVRSDNQTEAVKQFGDVFFQKGTQRGTAKGLFDPKSKVIKLFEKADASTLPHELSHYWLDNMWSYATSGLASETYLAQFQAVKDFLGVSPNQKYLTPNQHEKFASAYEKYIHRGIIPNSLMGNVFDDYERFIRKVYDSIEDITYATRKGDRKAVKLTPNIIKFFDSMVTGGIDVVRANELVASQMNEQEIKKAVENNVREAKQVVAETEVVHKENRQNVMTPVKTDTKTSYLTAYEKMTGGKVEAGAVELAKEMEKAEKFVSEDLERAKRIVNGEELPPENMLKNTIYLAYNEVQKKLGNTQERAESMLNQALELHRYGQEISSQQLAYNSTFQKLSSAQYWMDRTISNLEDIASKKANMPAEELSQKIKSAVQEGVNQGKTAEEIAKQIADETGLVLYQTEELPKQEFESKTAAYNYVYKYVNERLGLSLTKEQALEITRRADEMMQSLENSIGDYGNPSADYFRKLSDMEAYANSLAPSSALRIYTDLIGPTNLMASIKTPAFNIIANVPVLALRIAGRRAKIGQMTSIVPKENIKQYLKKSSEIFRETGYNLSTMTTDTPQKTILGEKITHFNETSKLQKVYADFLKYGIGYGDLIFKDFAFVDSVALQATKESNGNESKAVELFNDAVRVEPTTDIGKQIRLEAQTDALVSTYQNEGAFASGSLKIRSGIDKMTYGLLGKFFIPFAKTPGNVIGYSAEKAFGPAVELAKGIITGKVDKPKLKMLMAESALAYFLSAALVFLGTDDDDYMPPYALADEKTKQVARELNIPYNSIRIGNKWYSLDIIGPLGAIVSGFLQARRDDGIIGRSAAFLSGTLLQLGSIPGIGGVSNITEGVEKQINKIKQNKGEEAGLEMIESVIDALYSRTVPAFVSDIAKVFDQYEREAKGFQKIQKKIPFARNLLEEKISKTTGQAEPRGEPITRIITDILAGARIKEQIINDIADEVFRLNSVGEGVNLSDITRSGDLAKLTDEQKRDALIMFAQEYSQKVDDLIKTSSYKSKTDEGKKDAINDVRRAIVKKIKSKYSKELKELQKKR